MTERFNFEMAVSIDKQTGALLAAYFRIRKGQVQQTKEFADGNAFADYDRRGACWESNSSGLARLRY